MSFSNPILTTGTASGQSIYSVVTTPLHRVGTVGTTQDGKRFEYVRMDQSTAIGKGKLATYEPVAAATDKITITTAAAIGATSVIVPLTLTLVANELAGGFVSVDDDTGEAELYPIAGHAAHSSGDLTLYLDRPLAVAWTTSTTVTVVYNACSVKISAAVVAAAQPVEVAAGVPLVDIPVGNTTPNYFWVQKSGLANVLFGTAVGAVGQPFYHGEDAGSFQASVQTTAEAGRVHLGTIAALLPVDTEYHVVRLNIP